MGLSGADVRGECKISAIGRYDNWDHRECAVDNADHWKAEVSSYLKSSPPSIPKVVHQIWIGEREPPCVWLDTWRVDFMNSDGGEDWEYKLWDNETVAGFTDMVNQDLFEIEQYPQCRADLLRLEILYKYGGVYIDADCYWLGKRLDSVWEDALESGFACSYEPDTKDKPYSVLGNSVILASKGHPLLRLLMGYIANVYHDKRPHHGVEWVTGPLAWTKALVHTGMPFHVPEQVLFYPAFHYVPNPGAVNLADFPDSILFQFGYSCSGLSEWVKHNNRCRRALECPHHSKKTDYPFGPIVPFPKAPALSVGGPIPQVIHQFRLSNDAPPKRWMATWDTFAASNPGFVHKVWTYESLAALGGFFCSNMYPAAGGTRMDADTVLLLALEILYKEGGFYVPLSTIYKSPPEDCVADSGFPPLSDANGDVMKMGSILGCVPGAAGALDAIKMCYKTGKPRLSQKTASGDVTPSNIRDQGVGDDLVCYTSFAEGSRFLGASEIFFTTKTVSPRGAGGAEHVALAYAYDCQVPLTPVTYGSLEHVRASPMLGKAVFVVDGQIALYPNLLDTIPGFIYHANNSHGDNWSYIVIGMEWNTGIDEEVLSKVSGPFRNDHMTYVAVVVNEGKGHGLPKEFSCGNDVVEALLGKFDSETVLSGAVRFAHTEELSSIYRAMPVVQSVFSSIGHEIPSWDRDETEIHGCLLKGLRGGQMVFELSVDPEKRVMYRAFEDGGLNCEIKINQSATGRHLVDYYRVFHDHQVVMEGTNRLV